MLMSVGGGRSHRLPTLLVFSQQVPRLESKLADVNELKDRPFMRLWIEQEASNREESGLGGAFIGGMFGVSGR